MAFTLFAGATASAANTVVSLDVVTETEINYSRKTVSHPTEASDEITDNSVKGNTTINIDGVIAQNLIGDYGDSLTYGDRIANIYGYLKRAIATGELVTVVTGLDSFSNCVLVSASFPKKPEDGQIQHFRLTFEQIRLVKTQSTQVSTALVYLASKVVKVGDKKGEDSSTSTEAKSTKDSLVGYAESLFPSTIRATSETFK